MQKGLSKLRLALLRSAELVASRKLLPFSGARALTVRQRSGTMRIVSHAIVENKDGPKA